MFLFLISINLFFTIPFISLILGWRGPDLEEFGVVLDFGTLDMDTLALVWCVADLSDLFLDTSIADLGTFLGEIFGLDIVDVVVIRMMHGSLVTGSDSTSIFCFDKVDYSTIRTTHGSLDASDATSIGRSLNPTFTKTSVGCTISSSKILSKGGSLLKDQKAPSKCHHLWK